MARRQRASPTSACTQRMHSLSRAHPSIPHDSQNHHAFFRFLRGTSKHALKLKASGMRELKFSQFPQIDQGALILLCQKHRHVSTYSRETNESSRCPNQLKTTTPPKHATRGQFLDEISTSPATVVQRPGQEGSSTVRNIKVCMSQNPSR